MKLVQSLASVITGFAILATVGNTSASAADFDLSGTLQNGDTFSGTYSYSGQAPTSGSDVVIPTFSIKAVDTNGILITTFNSNNGDDATVSEVTTPNSTVFDVLSFSNENDASELDLDFSTGFQGTGIIQQDTDNQLFAPNVSNGNIASATSTLAPQAVPEPSTIVGTLAVGAVLMTMGLKKSKKQRAFQVA